jgi:hypothetical protein
MGANNWAPGVEAWKIVTDIVVPAAHPQPIISVAFVQDKDNPGIWELWVSIHTRADGERSMQRYIPTNTPDGITHAAREIASRLSQWV